jgi:hypothetical protein
MSLLDIGGDTGNASPNYIPPPKPKTSAWADVGSALTAVPRGVAEAGAQVMGTAADLAHAARVFRDTPSKDMKAKGLPVDAYSSDLGDALRDRGREFRPDPETASTAEQVLYGFARGATKIVAGAVAAGPAGVLAAGAEEAFTQADELKRQGVDVDTRGKAGLVQGAGLALAALPAAGTTIKSTLALYAAGGPGGFVAQQALTREILQSAGYDKIGLGFDPFDPVGLAVASLIPAGFAAYGFRQAKIAAAVRDLPDLKPPVAETATTAEPMPSRLSPIADAVRRYPQEVEDAARVLYQAEVREQSSPAYVPRVPPTETPPFRAWFEGSKVVDDAGAPLVVYKGMHPYDWTKETATYPGPELDSIARTSDFPAMNGEEPGIRIAGFFGDQDTANRFSRLSQNGAVFPTYLALKNPLVIDAAGKPAADVQFGESGKPFRDAMRSGEYDGAIIRNTKDEGTVYVAMRPEQIKSAIGNSGRFDPNSGSLTDMEAANKHADALARAEDQMARGEPVQVADVAPLTAWHGSPHLFDTFDASKIGTGEGAQAYGHGLYLAESPGVAKSYKEQLGAGRGIGDDDTIARVLEAVGGNSAKAAEELRKRAQYANIPGGKEKLLAMAEKAEAGFDPRGNLYKVSIPRDMEARMLDWDKPLSEQPPEVQKKLLSHTDIQDIAGFREGAQWADEEPGPWQIKEGMTGGDLVKAMEAYFAGRGQGITRSAGPSEQLRQAGVPGIKYLDGGSRGAGEGTRNFVIFPGEESKLTITERNGTPFQRFVADLTEAVQEAQKANPEPTTPVANAQQLDAFFAQTKPAATEPGAAFDAAAPARLDEIRLQYPDLMVQMDGGAPMRMDDFLAAAKAEADELAADAPLMKAAAECALTFGL